MVAFIVCDLRVQGSFLLQICAIMRLTVAFSEKSMCTLQQDSMQMMSVVFTCVHSNIRFSFGFGLVAKLTRFKHSFEKDNL